MCGATETRMDALREKQFHDLMQDDFHCITKIRKKRKSRDYGSGGLALIVRKGKGVPKLAKNKGSDEILWVEMEKMDRKIFVAVVYLVPSKSSRYKNNGAVRRELEEDIVRFRNEGMVIVLGDLNSRIGESNPAEGVRRSNMRQNKDKKMNDNGREWIKLISNTDMVTLTGLFGVADYTCYNENGNSVVDHICVDRRNKELIESVENRKEVMGRINTDHSMVVARVKMRMYDSSEKKQQRPKGTQKVKKKKKTKLNRIKKKEVWEKYKKKCERNREIMKTLRRIDEEDSKKTDTPEEQWAKVKDLVGILETYATEIAKKEGSIHLEHINKKIKSNSEIADLIENKKKAWKDLRDCKHEEEGKVYRRVFKNKKNILNKARKKLREEHKREMMKEIESLRTTYPGVFWKQLKAAAGRSRKKKKIGRTAINEEGNEVDGEEVKRTWRRAFENLGKKEEKEDRFDHEFETTKEEEMEEIERQNTERGEGELNEKIRFEEVRKVIRRLNNGKAAGIDEIVNEIIKYGGDPVYLVIWQLIKKCFETEKIPQDWMKGIIFPIYKAGDGRNPDNYRGISLLCIIGKIYTAVIHNRLSSWCEENGILAEEQGGFRPGRGCLDQLYVLVNILRNRVGRKTYCCFIDLRKAYDRVWRIGLWKRLWDEGIRGKIWRIIRNLYERTQSCVLVDDERTDFFDVEVGVRQGCVLSPTLFAIFINNLAREISESGVGIDVGGKKVAILLYADDIVIITDSAEDLKKSMKIATNWGKQWRCSFNRDKSQVVVFGQRKKREHDWRLGDEKIDQVEGYKYLGLDIKGNLRWKVQRERLVKKARRNMAIAWAMGIQSGHLSVAAAVLVWKTLVRPIVDYGAEIWGDERWEDLDKLQRDMGKRILGLKGSTNNEVVLGELGWWPMKARRDMLRLRYWRKLIVMDKERLPKRVYEWELKRKTRNCWTAYTKKILLELGLRDSWEKQEAEESKDEWNKLIFDRIQDREQKNWWKRVTERPKLRTYRKVKKKLEFEEYLNSNDEKGRRAIAKLRSGTNCLRIETGRHVGLNKESRKCWFGCDAIEDEKHFLMQCEMYDDIREEIKKKVDRKEYRDRGLEMMLGKGSSEELKHVMVYINRALARRRRILELKES